MTNSPPDPAQSAIQAALDTAGREIGAAFAEAGYRIVASTALGQVIAGLPDAAGGILHAMTEAQRHQLAEHALALYELAVDRTEDGAIVAEHVAKLPVPNAQSWHNAQAYLHALDRRDAVMLRFIEQAALPQLHDMRDAAERLYEAIDRRLERRDKA